MSPLGPTPQPPTLPTDTALPVGSPAPATDQPREYTEDEIIAKWGQKLFNLVQMHCRNAVDRERVFQLAVIQRNEFFYRGKQNLAPTYAGTSGDVVAFKPVDGRMLLASGNDKFKTAIYDYVINNFRGDVRKFVGVLGSKNPNARAMPQWPSDKSVTGRCDTVTDCINYLKSQWDVEAANRFLVLSLAKNGTTFFHTPFVTNKDRYGVRQEPVWGSRQEKTGPDIHACPQCGLQEPIDPAMPETFCPQCGHVYTEADVLPAPTQDIPTITDYKDYPRGTVELFIYSGYDVTTPFYIKNLTYCPWLWLNVKEDCGALLSKYPDKGLDQLLEKSASYSRGSYNEATTLQDQARDQASAPSAIYIAPPADKWMEDSFWLQSTMYNYLLAPNGDKELYEVLRRQYPRGCKLVWVETQKMVSIQEERLDEVWAASKPETSEFLYADPYFNDYIQGSMIINDAWNIQIQIMETSIPAILYRQKLLNPKMLKRGKQPNEYIPVEVGVGEDINRAFAKLPVSEIKPELFNFQGVVLANIREILGLLPAIWGGDDNTQTAEQSRRRLNQALMMLATPWNEMRSGWAQAYRNGARQLARYSLGTLVSSQGDVESVTTRELQDIQDILKGGWKIECDPAIPMSWNQLREFMMEIMTNTNPQVQQLIGLFDPENLDQISQGIGLPGWDMPRLAERNRIYGLIQQLLQGQPTMGMDGSPQPSIPLNFVVEWNPQMVQEIIHIWAMSEEAVPLEGTPGYQNVLAAGQAAAMFMIPQQAAPGSPSGPGGAPAGPEAPKELPPPGGGGAETQTIQ